MVDKHNGDFDSGRGDADKGTHLHVRQEDTLYAVLHRMMEIIFYPDPDNSVASVPVLHRIKVSLSENAPLLRDASTNTGRNIVLWTRRGSPLRSLLVIFVGTTIFLMLTGLLVFMLFFVVATFNAVVISLLVSLAAAGSFLAIFFACLAGIYIGALSVAAFVISLVTISSITVALVATGWVGFFCALWLATKKSMDLAKNSLSMATSVLSRSPAGRQSRSNNEKVVN